MDDKETRTVDEILRDLRNAREDETNAMLNWMYHRKGKYRVRWYTNTAIRENLEDELYWAMFDRAASGED